MLAHPDFGSFAYWGGLSSGLVSLIFAGTGVSEVKRARNALSRVTARGRVIRAVERMSKAGGVTSKDVTVTFMTDKGIRIKFNEVVDERYYHLDQEVTVHYDPQQPRSTATVLTKRAAFSRVLMFAVPSLLCLGLFVLTVGFGYYK